MYTASHIRRHIDTICTDKPFSIRDFLIYGTRNVIDQVFYRLVTYGHVIRVARGVYIKNTAPMPTVAEVAMVKAAAFCKKIAIDGPEALCVIGLKDKSHKRYIFATSGCSSSFRIGNSVVRFRTRSGRKMQLGDSPVGLVIRALWHLQKKACDDKTAAAAVAKFEKKDRQILRQSVALMPAWMHNCFASFARMTSSVKELPAMMPC
jgi:hypothetical protein